ncbi:MAG: DUF4911 domain-containing protein [Oligoflexia bacterium]|nr:DUF4911 domain-containing protein [Oligoflexia bacterium]
MKKQLNHLIIRVPKHESAFTYFQLESHEGLCFYSTLESSMGEGYRDLELFSPKELESEFRTMLKKLQDSYPIEILKDELVDDGKSL